MVLSTFILWLDMLSNLSSVSRSGGTDAGLAIATMTSSTNPRSFMTGPSAVRRRRVAIVVICESSLLRNKPQYPTKGHAPHSGRGRYYH